MCAKHNYSLQKIKHFGEYVGKQKTQLADKQPIGFFFRDLVRIQTLNLYSRNVVLYSVELRSHLMSANIDILSKSANSF